MSDSLRTVGIVGVETKGSTPSEVEFDGPQGTFVSGGGGAAVDHLQPAE